MEKVGEVVMKDASEVKLLGFSIWGEMKERYLSDKRIICTCGLSQTPKNGAITQLGFVKLKIAFRIRQHKRN